MASLALQQLLVHSTSALGWLDKVPGCMLTAIHWYLQIIKQQVIFINLLDEDVHSRNKMHDPGRLLFSHWHKIKLVKQKDQTKHRQ